jgi:hypothetical protein
MSRLTALLLISSALAACSANPAPTTTAAVCSGNRVLIVNNGGDEAVRVYAVNGRTSVEIGTAPQGKKEITIPRNVRATSFYAVAISQLALSGSSLSAPTDTRITFQEDCRAM